MRPSRKANRAGSLEEVILFANTVGATEKAARWYWFKCEGADWHNGGKPIKNWKAVFMAWWEADYFPRNTYPAPAAAQSLTLDDLRAQAKAK